MNLVCYIFIIIRVWEGCGRGWMGHRAKVEDLEKTSLKG
jgi:hypothetical protein